MKDFMVSAGIIAIGYMTGYMIAASLDYITNGGIRKDILSVEEYVSQQENCKKHGMQSVVAKNKDNQVVQVLCSTGDEVLKAK